ncbi:MAG TPA: M23 family metallopeptidase [Kofleriaceae bacterium]|nr:M23 family metallopeptidase [Kofleriaceae bacterium]
MSISTHRSFYPFVIGIAACAFTSACVVEATNDPDRSAVGTDEQRLTDPAVGVSVIVPKDWSMKADEVLFDTHGFILYAPSDSESHPADAVARIALAYQADASDLSGIAAAKRQQYAEVDPVIEEIILADGRRGVAVTGLPGTQPYSVVYTSDGDRVYEIGLWTENLGLDDGALDLLQRVRFEQPSVEISSLALLRPEAALYGAPPGHLATLSREAEAERRAAFEAAAQHEPALMLAATQEVLDPPVELQPGNEHLAATCGFTAPNSLYWQLQWDNTNTFYSGSWYNLRNQPGWSAMSGNYGSWWGTNFHIWKCHAGVLNQWFANDWPAQYWANAYAAFSGYVEWAGWGTDGFASLGRYVVVRNGGYRSLTAHLTRIASGVTWGTWINGYWKVIGYAGDTGESYANANWAPHLHARVGWGERLTYNGQPYGGQSVRPLRLRCFTCNDYDVKATGDGGFYTSFWHGRWMKY